MSKNVPASPEQLAEITARAKALDARARPLLTVNLVVIVAMVLTHVFNLPSWTGWALFATSVSVATYSFTLSRKAQGLYQQVTDLCQRQQRPIHSEPPTES